MRSGRINYCKAVAAYHSPDTGDPQQVQSEDTCAGSVQSSGDIGLGMMYPTALEAKLAAAAVARGKQTCHLGLNQYQLISDLPPMCGGRDNDGECSSVAQVMVILALSFLAPCKELRFSLNSMSDNFFVQFMA